jgi:hypothetical protein
MSDAERHVCAVCSRVLAIHHHADGTVSHEHDMQELPEDHLPVPVLPGEVTVHARCDFCNEDLPGPMIWVLPVRDFPYGPDVPDTGSKGDWAACDTCGPLIMRGQWSVVLRRGIQGWEKREGVMMHPTLQQVLGRMYRDVRKHAAGAIRQEPA